jgi:hypothetical protein
MWKQRAHLTQFVGYSPDQSSLMANVWHLQQTNHINPQFHQIHNNNFKTMFYNKPLDHPLSDHRLLDIFDTSCDFYADIEGSYDGATVYAPPPFNIIWLDESKHCAKKVELTKECSQAGDWWRFEAESPPVLVSTI